MQATAHHTIRELEQRALEAQNVTQHAKLRAMILAKRGWTAEAIAEAFGKARRPIQDCVYAYNRERLDGLDDRCDGRIGNRFHGLRVSSRRSAFLQCANGLECLMDERWDELVLSGPLEDELDRRDCLVDRCPATSPLVDHSFAKGLSSERFEFNRR